MWPLQRSRARRADIPTQGKALVLGYRELLGRQQLMQDCGVGVAGLRNHAQLEEMTILFDQLISTEKGKKANGALRLQPRAGAGA